MAARDLAAAGITDPALRASYETCRRLHARHGRTYYLATLLLPPAKRPYVWALYGFARHADEIVDEVIDEVIDGVIDGGHASTQRRAARLREWSERRLAELRAGRSSDPIGRALTHTQRTWNIPVEFFEAFARSMEMDLTVREYKSFGELQRYVYGSAAVIGLQMLPILQPRTPEAAPHAQALGVAFQLSNFLRDVAEDLARGRLYLPLDSLAAHDVTRADLERGTVTPPVRALLRYEVARARRWYARAEPGVAMLHPSSRECVGTALRLYSGILDEIERRDFDVFSRRARVGRLTRLGVGLPAYARARRTWPAAEPVGAATEAVGTV
jgi:15-cis-phytoene synthase